MAETQTPEREADPRPTPRGIGPVGWLRWAWRQLTSMRTALVLLFLLALASVPGGLLPQRAQDPTKVNLYLKQHATLGPLADRLSLFNVFSASWYVAIYLLLFVSLAGCVIPRAWVHFKNIRARPPATPRHLGRLPQHASFETDAPAEEVLAQARAVLKRRRFRADLREGSVAAEKGHMGETGNLTFHIALLVLLLAVGLGSAYGYKGNVLLTEGNGFSNSLSQYDSFNPGRAFDASRLSPFTIDLQKFTASYVTSGEQTGMARTFTARVRYVDGPPGTRPREYNLKVNSPLSVGGTKVYLLGHGYSPVFTVRDGKGNVAFQDAVPFLTQDPVNLTGEGVIKVPDAQPSQLAFYGNFFPSATADKNQVVSSFPAPLNPMVSLYAFQGNLGLNSGVPQSVYQLEGMGKTLFPIKNAHGVAQAQLLKPGETMTLPGGYGSITFDGYKQWVSLQITRDPGRAPALAAGIIAIFAIITSFFIRRRRVWVRAAAESDGRTVVEVGGLSLGNPTSEFDDIVAELSKDSSGGTAKAAAGSPESDGSRAGSDDEE
jgi:cytochrome c biogenesis protein